MLLGPGFGPRRGAVEDGDFMPRLDQMPRHWRAHHAHAQECDLHRPRPPVMHWRGHSAPSAAFDSSVGRAYLMSIMTNAASPARRFAGDHLVIASHNKGKIPEIAALLEGRVPRLTSAVEHGVPEPEETGD